MSDELLGFGTKAGLEPYGKIRNLQLAISGGKLSEYGRRFTLTPPGLGLQWESKTSRGIETCGESAAASTS